MTAPISPALVVGLGNPGPQYERTRHNVGQMVVDVLAARVGSGFRIHKKSGADVVEARLGSTKIVLAKPRTFMNVSGRQIGPLANFFGIPAENVIVIHDELDLEFGTIRLKRGGGEGGHNGLKSLTAALSTRDYLRVRFGIGRPPGRQDPADFVLKPFSSVEQKELAVLVEHAADAAEQLLELGLEAAQNRLH
ncbi:aminoacyl-tRNA hydrolase [Smaragdicoccus niigatensis]|uniref:aminoacyl-tRNA hydrolase n=1 Tax=Smaragdicoccus niigatensis TaxID=359359 RepID=UPI000370B7D4|nr:aminoacyl-tRNA hydrolase [Smaragdicoccus niigatensis]